MRLSLTVLLSAFATCSFGQRAPADAPARVLSICAVLAEIPAYRGKTIAIRGVYTYDGLRQDDCSSEFVTGDHHWPPVLNLVLSDYPDGEKLPVGFTTDVRSWRNLATTAIEAGRQGRSVEIWATIIGLLRARKEYVRPGGAVSGGFGHLGVLPAEIVIERVVDVRVKPVENSRYDYRLKPKAM